MIELVFLIIAGILMLFIVGWFIMLFFRWVVEESNKSDRDKESKEQL